MAIKTVKAVINGTTYNLTYDASLKAWTANATAPGSTSYTQPNKYFDVQVTATNDAGTSASVNGTSNSGCQLVVKETVKPVITITSPSNGAYVSNNKPPIIFTVVDEAGGSGVNINSLVVTIDDAKVTTGIVSTTITNGFSVTVTPSTSLTDGSHTVKITCSDNDGNAADAKTTTFKVDTVPPSLNVSSPTEGLITANKSLVVNGTTNDATSSPVTVTVNGSAVTVGTNGSFSTTVTLTEGSNTITVIAKDTAGKTTTITRHVTLNTKAPKISTVTITPNPANTGASMIIKVVVDES